MKPVAHILLEKHLGELGFGFQAEFRFHPTRKWRLDYVLTRQGGSTGIAVEIEADVMID